MLELLGLSEDASDYYESAGTATAVADASPLREPPPSATGLERLPTLSDMRSPLDVQTDTGTLIERLWAATEEHEAVRTAETLTPSQDVKISNRQFRWSIVVAALVTLVGGLTLLQIGTRLPAERAAQAQADYRSALAGVTTGLPEVRSVLQSVTDPAVETDALSEAAVALSGFDAAARRLLTVASEPLTIPPLVPRDELDALTPTREDMVAASDRALAIERRLGDALSYRLVFLTAFQLPYLPAAAAPDEISALGVELGLSLAETLDAVAQLPPDPFFEVHREQADQLADRYAEWQVEYLTALRDSDPQTAQSLAGEIESAVGDIVLEMAAPLAAVREWGNGELDRLNAAIAALAESLSVESAG